MGGEFALAGGFASPSDQIPLAVFPPQAPLVRLLDAPAGIVVLRIVRLALPLHLALETTNGSGIRSQFSAEHLQAWGALAGDHGNGRWPQVQPNGVLAHQVFGFL